VNLCFTRSINNIEKSSIEALMSKDSMKRLFFPSYET
jgi:hypothetical protein